MAYRSAKILGIYEEITAHMKCGYEKVKRENTFYTPERVREEASKFNSPTDFHQNARNFYVAAQRLGILADVTKHMDRVAKPNGYWTLDRLMKEASKYKTRKEFAKSNYAAFCATYRHPQKTEILASLESTNWITRNTGMVYLYLTKGELNFVKFGICDFGPHEKVSEYIYTVRRRGKWRLCDQDR